MRRIIRVLIIILVVLLVITAAGYLWAYFSTGSSLVAHGIMWGDARADDWKRYPVTFSPLTRTCVLVTMMP